MPGLQMKLFELMPQVGFDAEVLLRNDEGTGLKPTALLRLLMLDSARDSRLKLKRPVHSRRRGSALAAVIALFNSGFDED